MKELDIVLMKDGRKGTIICTFDEGNAFMIEILDESGKTIETPIIKLSEIVKIIYVA